MCEQPKININRGLEESIIQFLVALWQRAMQQAQKQSTSDVEQRAEVIHKNILKINGFPIGELDLAGVEQAVRLGGDSQPQTAGQEKAYSCRCMRGNHSESCNNARNLRAAEIVDLSSLSSAHRERIEEFALRFVELSESGHLEAIAGIGVPHNNAGVYQGRIAEIDPMRWRTPVKWAKPGENHNMTNITHPILSDDLNDDELNDLDDDVEEEVENPEMFDDGDLDAEISDNMEGQSANKILIPISDEAEVRQYAPAPIRFSLDSDGVLNVEAKVSPIRAKESSWWRGLSPKAKRSYLERHPNSKYAKAYRRKLAQKQKANHRLAGKGKNATRVVKELDREAEVNEEQLQEEGIEPGEDVAEELSNEQDDDLDDLMEEMDEHVDDLEDDTKPNASEDEDSEDDEKEEPQIHAESAEKLHEASKKKGFFTPVVNAVKKRASKSTLGSMKRWMDGTADDDDKQKAIRGLALLASAVVVVGVGAGIGALAGPGAMTHYIAKYVEGGGFNFGGKSESAAKEDEIRDESEEELDKAAKGDTLSNEQLEELGKHFVAWLADQSKQDQKEA